VECPNRTVPATVDQNKRTQSKTQLPSLLRFRRALCTMPEYSRTSSLIILTRPYTNRFPDMLRGCPGSQILDAPRGLSKNRP